MDSEYYEAEKLAQCFLVKLDKKITIPDNILETIKPLGKNLVAVVPGESKKISFFLTNASQILFVRLFLNKDQLNDTFFTSLRKTLKKLGISNLFSTGLCFKAETCVWEGVFEFDDDSKFENIKAELSSVKNVKKASFEKMNLIE